MSRAKKRQKQTNYASYCSHDSRRHILPHNQYHVHTRQPQDRRRRNDIVVDIRNLQRQQCIEYQYYCTKPQGRQKQAKELKKSESHHEYGLNFVNKRQTQLRRVSQGQDYHRQEVGKIVKNFKNERLTQATAQTPKKFSRQRFYSQTHFVGSNQTPNTKQRKESILLQKLDKNKQVSRYNTLLKSKRKSIEISAYSDDYFYQINIKCSKSNKDKAPKKDYQKGKASKNSQSKQKIKCPHNIVQANRKRSQTVAVNTSDYGFREKANENQQTTFTSNNKTGAVLLRKDSANDKTCLSKEALLEEVIYLRDLALRLFEEKQKTKRRAIPQMIKQQENNQE